MKSYPGVLDPEIMMQFPSGTATPTFPVWIANFCGLESVLAVAGFLDPEFHEVGEHVFWDRHVAESLERRGIPSSFDGDPTTVERYYNVVNLAEFFLLSADAAVDHDGLVQAFGSVLQRFWSRALRERFPDRDYQFEISPALYKEEGLCLTFWRRRS